MYASFFFYLNTINIIKLSIVDILGNLTILPTIGAPPPYEEYAKVIIEEGVKVVETAGSNPQKWVRMFKEGLVL